MTIAENMNDWRLLRRFRKLLNEIGPIAIGLGVIVWMVLVFRVLGAPDADYGNFISVAERLIAGDRLYADVYENKDPLLHYFFASSRIFSPLGFWFLSILYLLLGSLAVWLIGRASGLIARTAFIAAFIATPIVMTGASFFPGSSHIPAVAFVLLAFAAAIRGKWTFAGSLVAVVCALKLILFPMALLVVLVAMVLTSKRPRNLFHSFVGFVATASILYFVVFIRGELEPYLNNLKMNLTYSQSATDAGQGLSAVRIHFDSVMNLNNQISFLAIAAILFWPIAVVGWRVVGIKSNQDVINFQLFAGATIAVFYSLAVIGITGLWGHHALVFIVPACIGFVLFLKVSPIPIARGYPATLPLIFVLSILLAGMPSASGYLDDLLFARAKISGLMEPGNQAKAIIETGPPTSYARVGNGRDGGHGFGLSDWTLECPKFAQEIWESGEILSLTAECLPLANVILITKDVGFQESYPEWNAFVNSVDEIVSNGYACELEDVGRVCRRVGT